MAENAELKAVGDDVPRVDGSVAVGEDLPFQRRWWKFERLIWMFFTLVLAADLSGILGRGPLAKAERHSSDGTVVLKYEWVLRENTASMLTILPGQGAIAGGKLQLFVSDELLKQLGTQRVIPQPETSAIGGGGVTYTFAATQLPMTVQMELKPARLGEQHFSVAAGGGEPVQAGTFVLP